MGGSNFTGDFYELVGIPSDRVLRKKLFINQRGGILEFYWCEVLNMRFRVKSWDLEFSL